MTIKIRSNHRVDGIKLKKRCTWKDCGEPAYWKLAGTKHGKKFEIYYCEHHNDIENRK